MHVADQPSQRGHQHLFGTRPSVRTPSGDPFASIHAKAVVAKDEHQGSRREAPRVCGKRGGDLIGHQIEALAERWSRFPQPRLDRIEFEHVAIPYLDPPERRRRADHALPVLHVPPAPCAK